MEFVLRIQFHLNFESDFIGTYSIEWYAFVRILSIQIKQRLRFRLFEKVMQRRVSTITIHYYDYYINFNKFRTIVVTNECEKHVLRFKRFHQKLLTIQTNVVVHKNTLLFVIFLHRIMTKRDILYFYPSYVKCLISLLIRDSHW